MLKVSIWNLQIKEENHKKLKMQIRFFFNLLLCCFSNFVGSPCFDHNSKCKNFQCINFLCIHAHNQIQMCCEYVFKIVLDEG